MPIGLHKKKNLTSFQVIIAGFAGVILFGALILMLPVATVSRVVTPFHETLFTATSAVCVTGLVVQDTGSYWSAFGQTIIVILIGAIAFSLSIIGAPGVVAVSMLSIILTPLGIPSETIVLIYLATIPFFDPIAVFSSVYSNIAVTALVVPGKGKKEKNEVSK